MKSVKLDIIDLCVKYKEKTILENFNLTINKGEKVAILGESGLGKTTLLKAIAGIVDVFSGDIKIDDESILQKNIESRETVILFQDLRLFPHMNVFENIAFPMQIKKIDKKIVEQKVLNLLDEVKLSGFEKRKIKELSGGQMQRVALARALASEPKVLLLDEPFSALDEKLRDEMGELFCKVQNNELTSIIVTHSEKEAYKIADRVIRMGEQK